MVPWCIAGMPMARPCLAIARVQTICTGAGGDQGTGEDQVVIKVWQYTIANSAHRFGVILLTRYLM
jgi:hypothetical protein